jgi:hypothetical protein
MRDLEAFPAGARVSRGLTDLAAGHLTVDALMVSVAASRLSELGLSIPPQPMRPREPELSLYKLLCVRSEDPYSAYRAILRELDSFISCLETVGGAPLATRPVP